MMRKWFKFGAGIFGIIILIQFIPFGRDHNNPPIVQEPTWRDLSTRPLLKQACFDCHSNETVWPWYANVAPISWLIQYDVEAGRAVINFSDWGEMQQSTKYLQQLNDSIEEVILSNTMPPYNYLLLHPNAILPQRERDQMITGLKDIFQNTGLP